MRLGAGFFLLACTSVSLLAYTDSDFDGVEDEWDRCPQTPFSDLVDLDGCTVQRTGPQWHADFLIGIGSSDVHYAAQRQSSTTTYSLQGDVYYRNWSFQVSASRYASEIKSGMDDTLVALSYRHALSETLSLQTGAGLILPTYVSGYGNEALDYTASADLHWRFAPDGYAFAGYGYVWVNDTDTSSLSYRNSDTFRTGIGYEGMAKTDWSVRYDSGTSQYSHIPPIRSISVGVIRELSTHWFLQGGYTRYLGDTLGNYASTLRLGYYF
ncbi:MAG: hypothetical protein AB7S65_03480 [Sulfuricurvum sp.]